MSVLGSVSYRFESDVQPLLDSSKKAEESFGRVDKAAEKLDKSIGKLEKSHSVLGKAIKGIAIGGAGVGLGLLAKHLLAGTKAGDTLGKGLTYLQVKTAILKTHISGLLAPTTAWIQSTGKGAVVLGGLSKGLEHATKAYQSVDAVLATTASSIKTYTSGLVEAGRAGTLIPKVTGQAAAAFAGMKVSIAANLTAFKTWMSSLATAPPAVAALTGGVRSAGGMFSNFTRVLGQTWNAFNATFEQMERAGLGVVSMTGRFGAGAVRVSHFTGMLGLLGIALSFLPGPLGIVAGLVATATAGIEGLIFALGSVVNYIGNFASAIGERLTDSLREYVSLSSQAEVGILGFNTAIKAYNDHVEGAKISTSHLDEWMRKLSTNTGIAGNEIRQIVLRTLELSRITGLSTEQVKLLTERAIDLATAMHRDVWDGVWSVIDAMRGFPSMASGFGLALDNATLSNSEFATALGKSYKALDNNQQAQVIYQETMKQSAWATGFAAKMVGSTLVGSEMKAEAAIERLNTAIGVGVQTVWKPWSSVMSHIASLLNYLPAPMVHAYGTLKALTAMAFNAAGGFLSLAAKIVMVSAGFTMLRASGPLVLSTLNFLMQRLKLTTFSFLYLSDAVRHLATVGLTGLTLAIKGTVASIAAAAVATGKWLWWMRSWITLIGVVVLALGGLILAYKHFSKSSEEIQQNLKEEMDIQEDHITKLKAAKVAIMDYTKSEADRRQIILDLIGEHPKLIDALKGEKVETAKVTEILDEEIKKRKELNELLKKNLIERITEDLKKEETALKGIVKALNDQQERREKLEKFRSKLAESNIPGAKILLAINERNLKVNSDALETASAGHKKAKEKAEALRKELDRILGVQKDIGKVLYEGQGYKLIAKVLSEEELQNVEKLRDELEKTQDEVLRLAEEKQGLVNETYDLERSRAFSLHEALRDLSNNELVFEKEVLNKRGDILSSYQSNLIGLTTTTNKKMVEGFQTSSENYFNQLVRMEQERMTVHRRAAEVFTDEAQNASEQIADVYSSALGKVIRVYTNLSGASRDNSDRTKASLNELRGYYGSFADKVQEAYKYITGSQEDFLSALARTGPYTEDVIESMINLTLKVEKSYADQTKAAEKAMEEYEERSGRLLTEGEKKIKQDELLARKAQDMMKIYTQVYDALSSRQSSLIAKQTEAFAKLRQMEQDYLSRQADMEDVMLGLQRKAGERTVDDRTRFYQKMRDLEGRLQAAQLLTAEDRKKVDQELIRSAVGMVGDITDANGQVIMSEKEVATFVKNFVVKAYEDEKTASQEAATQVEFDMRSRSAAIVDVGDKISVVKSQMAAMQDVYNSIVNTISTTKFGFSDAVYAEAEKQAVRISSELDKLKKAANIPITVDEDKATSAINRIRQLQAEIAAMLSTPYVIKVVVDTAKAAAKVVPTVKKEAGKPTASSVPALQSATEGLASLPYQRGGEVIGRIPGFGGGDRVPLSAAPGQFVVRKEAVKKYGTDFLSRLSRVPAKELGGSQPRVPILAERGEFMIPRQAVAFHGATIFKKINARKFQAGGATGDPGISFGTIREHVEKIAPVGSSVGLSLLALKLMKLKKRVSPSGWATAAVSTIVIERLKKEYGEDWERKLGIEIMAGGGPAAALYSFAKKHPVVLQALQAALPFQKGGFISWPQRLQEGGQVYRYSRENAASLFADRPSLGTGRVKGVPYHEILPPLAGIMKDARSISAPPPAAPILSSTPQARGISGKQAEVSLEPAKKTAGSIEDIFDTMFKNLENKAKSASIDIGNALFENIYNKLRDRMVREAKMG